MDADERVRRTLLYAYGEGGPPDGGGPNRGRRATGDAAGLEPEPVLVRASDVQPRALRWLWHGRIPLGKLTLLDGDPGLGKSLVTLDLAARVSRGLEMPDGSRSDLGGPAGVVLLSAEDDIADTIRPRLEAAGADCSRIAILRAVRTRLGDDATPVERIPTLADLAALETAVREVGARLVVIDPVTAYVGATDTHIDAEVRQLLAPLADLAARLEVAILLVRHLRKGAGPALYRGGGSIAFVAAVRSALLVGPDPTDAGRRVLAPVKSNLAEPAPALGYVIEAPDGIPIVRWTGVCEHTAADILAVGGNDEFDRTALEIASDFLVTQLRDGPRPAREVLAAARAERIAERTLERARARLGIRSRPSGFRGPRLLELPESPVSAKRASPRQEKMVAETANCGGHWNEEVRLEREAIQAEGAWVNRVPSVPTTSSVS
jgi:hypothetical protein